MSTPSIRRDPRGAEAPLLHRIRSGAPLLLAVDDSMFRRRGKKVHAAAWGHDGSARGQDKIGFGNTWVVVALVVSAPFSPRPLALPVAARLWRPGGPSKPALARDLLELLTARFSDRLIHVVADCAYAGEQFRGLDAEVSFTTRLKSNAALYEPAPPRTGRRGRPRLRGARLPALASIAATGVWRPTTVCRYGTRTAVEVCTLPCLWYGALRTDAARLVLIREPGRRRSGAGYDIALITTDLRATPEDIVARYAARWSIEVTFHDAKNLLGIGEAQNRLRKAVERTVPFGLFCQTLLTIWYATTGHDLDDIANRRAESPWYTTKQHPSTHDFLTKFRRTVIAARFKPTSPRTATPEEIHAIHLAWEAAAA